MKKESLSTSMPKLILAVVLIVGIGAVMGLMGYYWTMPKGEVVIDNGIKKEKIKDNSEEEEIIIEIKYVCEQEKNKNKDGCYIRNARTIASTDYNKAKMICNLTSEPRKDDCALQILAIADIDKLKTKCEDIKDKTKKGQCYSILILKISEVDSDEAVELCETKSLSKDGCYASVAEKISFTHFAEIYNKALMICDKIKWEELKESCRENCKWNYEYEQEINETADWKTYRNEEFRFEFEYPDYWGNPTVKKQIIDISDDYFKEIIDAKDLPRIAKNEFFINFDGKFCFNNTGCYSGIRIIEYNANSPFQIDCYEGLCNTTNLLEEKKEVEQNSNILIGNLRGKFRDNDFVPGGSYERFYEVISSRYKFVFRSWYSHYLFNIPPKFQDVKTRGDVFLEEISKANPDQKDFTDFLETLKEVISSFKFIEKR